MSETKKQREYEVFSVDNKDAAFPVGQLLKNGNPCLCRKLQPVSNKDYKGYNPKKEEGSNQYMFFYCNSNCQFFNRDNENNVVISCMENITKISVDNISNESKEKTIDFGSVAEKNKPFQVVEDSVKQIREVSKS